MNVNYPLEMQEKTAAALRYLRSLKLDDAAVDVLWKAHTRKCEDLDRGEPTEWDKMYSIPASAPKADDHFAEEGGLPAGLDAHNMWPGYHYTLSAGQRKWFREVMGMTPARTITLAWVQVFPGTQHPASFKFESDVHVDPKHRKHIITSAIVRNVGRFFFESALFDSEIRAEKMSDKMKYGEKKTTSTSKRGKVVTHTRTLEEIMEELEE